MGISPAETVHPPRAGGGAEGGSTEDGSLSGRGGPTNYHGHARVMAFVSSVPFVVESRSPATEITKVTDQTEAPRSVFIRVHPWFNP